MPAQRLGNRSVSVFKYDVVAQDSASPQFIRHVGLADEERHDVSLNSTIAVAHMGPPLAREPHGKPIQACGTVALKISELRQIGVFVDEQDSEYKADKVRGDQQYIILPHCREPDASCSVRRFNCAGFVIEAYRYAGVDLVTTNMELLPPVDVDVLCRAYPDPNTVRVLQTPKLRAKFGLTGDGPWRVVLAGYVLNALDRPVEKIRDQPYRPKPGDALFSPTVGRAAP